MNPCPYVAGLREYRVTLAASPTAPPLDALFTGNVYHLVARNTVEALETVRRVAARPGALALAIADLGPMKCSR